MANNKTEKLAVEEKPLDVFGLSQAQSVQDEAYLKLREYVYGAAASTVEEACNPEGGLYPHIVDQRLSVPFFNIYLQFKLIDQLESLKKSA